METFSCSSIFPQETIAHLSGICCVILHQQYKSFSHGWLAKEETCSVLVDATVRCSDTLVLARLKREGDRFRMKVQDVSGILNEQDE